MTNWIPEHGYPFTPGEEPRRGSCLPWALCVLAWGIIFVGVGVGGLVYYSSNRERDNPKRVYENHIQQLDQYAKQLRSGQVQMVNDEYGIPQFLIDLGVRHVCKEQSCFVITFEFMPTDAVPQLWFSPDGFMPIPDPLVERYKGCAYFHFIRLSSNWAECEWDQ